MADRGRRAARAGLAAAVIVVVAAVAFVVARPVARTDVDTASSPASTAAPRPTDRPPSTTTRPAESSTTDTTTTAPPTTSPPPTTTAPVTSTVPDPDGPGALGGRVVVIDPGHNGQNGAHAAEIGRLVDAGGLTKACNTTGTADSGLAESTLAWDVALRVRAALEAEGAEVVLTRPDDDGWGPCVDERGRTAGRVGADALVSLHADGRDASSAGFHVMRSPLSGPGTDALATSLRDALVADGFSPWAGVGAGGILGRSDLGTLNLSVAPAAMIECGNMHNAGDLAVFTSPDGRQRIADAVAAGTGAFLLAAG